MELTWLDLLTAFEISLDDKGAADFAELVLRLINAYQWKGASPQVGKIVESMSRDRGCTTRQLYRSMRTAVRNILESEQAALDLWEIFPQKRTSSMLAVAIAEREIRRFEARKQAATN